MTSSSSFSTTTPAPTVNVISTVAAMQDFLDTISVNACDGLYIDLEGKDLGRNGTLTLITILAHPGSRYHIIDVQELGQLAFSTEASADSVTLKDLFQQSRIQKYLWDVRADADALFSLYGVGMANVIDVQLMENATRRGYKTYLRGLDKCVQYELNLKPQVFDSWLKVKKQGQAGMAADIFSKRPLAEETVRYCVGDVEYLPDLYDTYRNRISSKWMEKVKVESGKRVEEAHSPNYQPRGENKKFGPWGRGEQKRHRSEDSLEAWEQHGEDDFAAGYHDYQLDIGGYDDLVDELWDAGELGTGFAPV
jgi:exonuclease 3'-5' domain-containing protein 1